jgi:hypothetical protein
MPRMPEDFRQTLQLQLYTMRLTQLQLGAAIDPTELILIEGELLGLLSKACQSNLIIQQVDTLLMLGAVQAEYGKLSTAKERAQEVVTISDARRYLPGSIAGRVLLADLAIRNHEDATAITWESEARKLATDDEAHFAMMFQALERVRNRVAQERTS